MCLQWLYLCSDMLMDGHLAISLDVGSAAHNKRFDFTIYCNQRDSTWRPCTVEVTVIRIFVCALARMASINLPLPALRCTKTN